MVSGASAADQNTCEATVTLGYRRRRIEREDAIAHQERHYWNPKTMSSTKKLIFLALAGVFGLILVLAAIGANLEQPQRESKAISPSPSPRKSPEQERSERQAQAVKEFDTSLPQFTKALADARKLSQDEVTLPSARAHLTRVQTNLALLGDSELGKDSRVLRLKKEAEGVARVVGAATDKAEAAREAEAAETAAFNTAEATTDIEVVRSSWEKGGFGSVGLWKVRLRNTSKVASFYDFTYETRYAAPSGTEVSRGEGSLLDRLEPGQTKTFEVNDGFINSQAARASFSITGGKKDRAQRKR